MHRSRIGVVLVDHPEDRWGDALAFWAGVQGVTPAGEDEGAGEVPAPPAPSPSRQEESALEKAVRSPAAKQFARSAAAVLGREITRSIFGTSRRRRRR